MIKEITSNITDDVLGYICRRADGLYYAFDAEHLKKLGGSGFESEPEAYAALAIYSGTTFTRTARN